MLATPFHAALLWPAPGIGLVEVSGEVDMNTAQELEAALAVALQGRPERLIVDLGAVGFIDSVGLSVLAQNAKLAFAHGASFEIVCADAGTLRTFEITGLRDVLVFHASRGDALGG
jgi:anti-sigma B factor antagonist